MRNEYDFRNTVRTSKYAELYVAQRNLVAGGTKAIFIASLAELGRALPRNQKHFTLLLAMDATAIDDESIREAFGPLIANGLAYFCAWGPDCERVHDITDQVRDSHDPALGSDGIMMTTWHKNETLNDAVDFFTMCAVPVNSATYEGFDRFAVSVGNVVWHDEIAATLARLCDGSKHDPRAK